MAIYYENEKDDRKVIYDVAEKWENDCLLYDKSLIWPKESVWTKDNIARFKQVFVDAPDITGESFDNKFKKQLNNESEGVYKFAIELIFIYYMFPYPKSVKFETKLRKLEMIASWKDIELNRNNKVFSALKDGLGSTGTFFNTSKYEEISFLCLMVEGLKEEPLANRKAILNDRFKLKEHVERVREQIGKKVQSQHIILHLLLPKYFERIASWGNKAKIVKSFSNYLTDQTDLDDQLLVIRENLQTGYPDEQIDFHNTSKIEEQWRETEKKKSIKPKVDTGTKIPLVDFDVEPFQGDLIFEDLDLILSQIMTAIRNDKHIILTGPPGTGKSKLASLICDIYGVERTMITAASNWSTYETIGGYRPDKTGELYFDSGIFLKSVKNQITNQPENKWLIIDEINRADIDKAFGSLFSVLAGDKVALPFESRSGESIMIQPQGELTSIEPNDYTYIIPNDWRIIGTMNTIDKASLYEMSYAFMRRFAFIPVGVPKGINDKMIEQYLAVWDLKTYPHVDTLSAIWKLINRYRKIGPAIIEDIARYTEDNEDFMSAIILYVLPQFEGLPLNEIKGFVKQLGDETAELINLDYLNDFVEDFFDAGGF